MLLLLVAVLLGEMLEISLGTYTDRAISMAATAFVLVMAAFAIALKRVDRSVRWPRAVAGIVWASAIAPAWIAWHDLDLPSVPRVFWTAHIAKLAMLYLLVTYVPGLLGWVREPREWRLVRFALLGGLLLLAGIETIRVTPSPSIDVFTVQQGGAEALSSGLNPYGSVHVACTGPSDSCPTLVPYVYPPTHLCLTLPAYWLFGDIRPTMLAALLLAGYCMRLVVRQAGRTLPAIVEDAPALLIWCAPWLPFVVGRSWTDPIQLALISAMLAAHFANREKLTAILLGLAISSKQSMFWLAPIAFLILNLRPRALVLAASVAMASVLPFALWDPGALQDANFDFLASLPPREDALTFLNWASGHLGWRHDGALGFALAALVVAVTAFRLRGHANAFGIVLTATYFCFFAFNKWAFINYYFLIFGLCSLGAAAALHGGTALPTGRRPDPTVPSETSRRV